MTRDVFRKVTQNVGTTRKQRTYLGTTTPLAKSGEGAVFSDDEKYRDPLIRARLGLPMTAANEPAVSMKTQAAPEANKAAPIDSNKIEVSLVK
jgi:hypothetical protein